MAYICRLIIYFFLFFFGSSVFSAPYFSMPHPFVPTAPAITGSSASGVCGSFMSIVQSANPLVQFSLVSASSNICTFKRVFQNGSVSNSTASYSDKTCPVGEAYSEITGFCQPDTPPDNTPKGPCDGLKDMPLGLSDYGAGFGNKSVDWMKNQIGKPANSCFAGGCQVTGDVTGCAGGGVGSTYCKISNPTFNGKSCNESDVSGDDDNCQDGYSASQYAPGVCVPDSNKTDPTKDNNGDGKPDDADGLCSDKTDSSKRVPCDGKPSKCSGGTCESKYAPGLCIPCDTNVNSDKSTTTCNGTSCTTTKPDGTKDDKPKEQFCAENPKSPMCIENKWGGGSCASKSFSCSGDAIMCAIAQEQHLNNCKISKLFESDNDSSSLFNKAAAGTDEFSTDKMKAQAQQITVSSFNQSGFGWSHSCPADPSFNLPFAHAEFSIPFSKICPLLAILSNAGVGITLLGSLVWVLGGRNNRG